MKASRFSFYLFMLLLSGMTILSCSKDDPVEPDGGTEEPGIEEPEEPAGDEEMVLGEQTILITPELISHVSTPVTGMQIVLDNSIDEAELPKEGEILLNIERSDLFPHGFLGKVSQVNKTADGYVIDTEKAYLDEAFDKLYVEGEMEVVLPDESQARALGLNIGNYSDGDYKGITFGATFDDLRNCSKESYIGMTLNVGFVFEYIVDINNKIKKPYASFTLKSKLSFTPQWHIEYERGLNSDLYRTELTHLDLLPKLGAAGIAECIFNPELVLYFVAEAQGKVNIDTNLQFVDESVMGLEYKDGSWDFGSRSIGQGGSLAESAKFSLEGSAFSGLECALEAKVFSEEITSLSIPFKVGGKVSAEISSEIVTSADYETLSDLQVTFGVPNLSAGAKVSGHLFKGLEGDLSLSFFDKNLLEKKVYLFPKFEDMNAKRIEDDKTKADVSSNVTQDLLFPVEIDYNLYDEEENEIQAERNWLSYREEEDMHNPLTKTFTDLSVSKKYFVRPVVKVPLFGEIPAKPIVEIEPEEIGVTTESYMSQGSSLVFVGYFDPALQADCNITEYGICYDTNGNPTLYGTHSVADGNNEGMFQTAIIAEDDITYYYRAYLIADGQIYYGEVKEAKKEKNDSIIGYWKLKSTHSETIGADHPHDDPGWTWGDLLIMADGTFLTGDPTLYGNWGYSSGSLLLEYEDEGEMLNFYFRINQLDEQILDVVMTVYNDSEVYKMYVTFDRLY